MVKEKKNFNPHKGNKVNQGGGKFPFVDEFNTWRKNCQSISGGDLQLKYVDNLYAFLRNHMQGNIRTGSRNEGRDGEGAIQFLSVIEDFIDNNLFTIAQAKLIEGMAKRLEQMKGTGKEVNSNGPPAFAPAFIVFTEVDRSGTGEILRERKVQGHYATEWYVKNNPDKGVSKVPDDWMAGNNPPHQALFSETSTKFAKPRGLLYIMQDAAKELDEVEIDVVIDNLPQGVDAVDIDEIKSVEQFFNAAIKNQSFWSNGGKLRTQKLRKELEATEFKVKPNEQAPTREITNLGRVDEKDAIAGTVVSFRLTATATPIIELVDRALKRANTDKAPNGYRAWQGDTKRGFDYRKTRREKFGEQAQGNLDNKVISKMWQMNLWRR